MIYGLTGGIGSGKTTVAAILRDKGYIVLDADEIGREVTGKDEPLLRRGIWYSYSEHGSCYYCFYGDKYKDSGCVISLEDGIITPFKFYVYSEAGDDDDQEDEETGA